MYYTTLLTVDGEFVCCRSGDVIDESDDEYSLEQVKETFIFDTNSLILEYIDDGDNQYFSVLEEPTFHNKWEDAAMALWEAMAFIGITKRELIQLVIKDEFIHHEALLKLAEITS